MSSASINTILGTLFLSAENAVLCEPNAIYNVTAARISVVNLCSKYGVCAFLSGWGIADALCMMTPV
jgi:hypothetical protein